MAAAQHLNDEHKNYGGIQLRTCFFSFLARNEDFSVTLFFSNAATASLLNDYLVEYPARDRARIQRKIKYYKIHEIYPWRMLGDGV